MDTTQANPVSEAPLPPNTQFQFGRVLGLTLSAWSCNVLPFTAIAAIVYAPLLVYAFSGLHGTFDLERIKAAEQYFMLGSLLLEPIVAGLIARAVLRQSRGKPSGVREAIGESARQLLPLIGVTFVSAILIAGGVFALIVPAAFLYCAWFVSGPVAAAERRGVLDTLRRSQQLTAGHRLKILALPLLVFGATYLANKMLISMARAGTSLDDFKLFVAVYYLVAINFVTIRAVMRGAAYVELTGGAEPPAK